MAVRKIKLAIQYDGSDYHGWQTQPGFKTIQQTLNEALFSLVGRKVTVHGASRTDAGVSALGQAGLIELVNCPIPTENFPKAEIMTESPSAKAVFNNSRALSTIAPVSLFENPTLA